MGLFPGINIKYNIGTTININININIKFNTNIIVNIVCRIKSCRYFSLASRLSPGFSSAFHFWSQAASISVPFSLGRTFMCARVCACVCVWQDLNELAGYNLFSFIASKWSG